jgi:hypothetical protein
MKKNCVRSIKCQILNIPISLLYSDKIAVLVIKKKSLEVPSHKIESYRPFGKNLLCMAVNVYILLNLCDCF